MGGLIDVLGHVSSVPLEAPLNLAVLLENSTTIKVTWAAVDKETVRGHLLGYKVPPLLYLLLNDKQLQWERHCSNFQSCTAASYFHLDLNPFQFIY